MLFSVVLPAYGRGGKDKELAEVDRLIIEREFEEAIKILAEYSRNNPNKFDQAQERMRQIYRLRDEFNRTVDALIEAVDATAKIDPDDTEGVARNEALKHALSTRLYSLEKADNPILTDFVAREREISAWNVFRVALGRIMERGGESLEHGENTEAIRIYFTGMDFMRVEFYASGIDPAIQREVTSEAERLHSVINAFPAFNSQIEALSAELTAAINSGDMTRITQAISRLMPAIDRLFAQKNDIYTAAASLDRNLLLLPADDRDRNYIAFLLRIVNGRVDSNIQEGLFGVFDSVWRKTVGSNLTALASFLDRANTNAETAFKAGNYTGAIAALDRMESYHNLAGQFFDRHRQLFRGTQAQTIPLYGSNILVSDTRQFLELRALNEANNHLRLASNSATRHTIDSTSQTRWEQNALTLNTALAAEQQVRANINRYQREIEDITTRAKQVNTDINSYQNITSMQRTISALENYQTVLNTEEHRSAQRYYSIAQNSLLNNQRDRRDELAESNRLLEGTRYTITLDTGDTIEGTNFYPTEALQILTQMTGAITTALNNNTGFWAPYENENEAISSNAEVSGIYTRNQTTINEMIELRNQGFALADTARTRSSQAEAYRIEADIHFNNARAALQRQEFSQARNLVDQAGETINNSLRIQASTALRTTWDSQLLNLGETISRTEHEYVITEVRTLLQNSQTAFYATNFTTAEAQLIRARNLWLTTNDEENSEVSSWLTLVRNASSGRSGRDIPLTASLYAEMSQMQSQAERNYEEGARLVNAGDRARGIPLLEEARQITREIRLIFPLNQDAGVLDLQIERFLDPRAFTASFDQRIRTAIAETRNRSLEAYGDLLNLAVINPAYPGIQGIIVQAEVDMGYRPPAPNPADIAQSNSLTAAARSVLDGNITTLYPQALAQIDQAILLNPNNREAQLIKDRLSSRMNVPSVVVLTREDEEIYQRALRELQAGNSMIAGRLVNMLLENPRNQTIPKVVELQRRIQASL